MQASRLKAIASSYRQRVGDMQKHRVLSEIIFGIGFLVAMVNTSAAQLTTLHGFNGADGANPYRESLVQSTDGNFYGTTETGGALSYGLVFKMTPDGTVTTVHEFVGTDGEFPSAGMVQDAAGNFYGTARTAGPGVGDVFKITPEGTFSVLHGFNGTNECNPTFAPLLLAAMRLVLENVSQSVIT